MTADDSLHGLMLIYVAGCADEDEITRAEALLCGGSPQAVAAYAEATAVYHAMPMALVHVAPPDHCCDKLFGRITSDLSADTAATDPLRAPLARASSPALQPGQMRLAGSPASTALSPTSASAATRLRWPIYITSGIAACLAVALTMTMVNKNSLETRYSQAASALALNQEVLRSPQVSLANLEMQDTPGPAPKTQASSSSKPFGRVLFCPTGKYQFTLFNMPPLPENRVYQLWLITPDHHAFAAGLFKPDADGTVTVPAIPAQTVRSAAWAAVTDEPAGGSAEPSHDRVHLKGTLLTAQ